MDHHCPWINNCVGMLNTKYFVLFLLYTFIYCAFAFACTLISFFYTFPFENDLWLLVCTIGSVFLLLFSALFGVFSLMIFLDLIITICSGQTSIYGHYFLFDRD